MIKDFSIIGLIIIIVIFGHIFIQNALHKSSGETIEELQQIREEIIKSEKIDKTIQNMANKLYNDWRKKAENLSIIVDHQEVDVIEKYIISIQSSVETDETEMIISKIDEAIFLISQIGDKEKLNLKNIF